MADYNSCSSVTLASIDARCDISLGGIKRILIGKRSEWDITTGTVSGSTDDTIYVTDIARKEGMDTAVMYQFRFRRDTGSYTSTVSPDVAVGNAFATTDINLQFSKAEAKKRMTIQSLINNGDCFVIIEDLYGQGILVGKDNDVIVTSAVMQSGTASTDLNGFTITLQGIDLELPYFLVETITLDSFLTDITNVQGLLG